MKAEELAYIKERADKATSGPWVTGKPLHASKSYITKGNRLGMNIANAYEFSDAQFIAHAREDVPKLVAEVERLRSVIWRISDYCDMSIEETGAYLDGDDGE